MHSYFLLLLSFPLLVLSIPHWCRHPLAHSNHTPRPAHHPNSCQFGSGPGPCGGDVCLKGPGDVCGGARDRYGKCAEGLLCSDCNRYYKDGERKYSCGLMFHVFRCQGCSLTSFTCWYDDECISWWFNKNLILLTAYSSWLLHMEFGLECELSKVCPLKVCGFFEPFLTKAINQSLVKSWIVGFRDHWFLLSQHFCIKSAISLDLKFIWSSGQQ